MDRYFLDTHVFLWWITDPQLLNQKLSERVNNILNIKNKNYPFYLSEISLWEISMMVEYKKLEVNIDLATWLEQATAKPLIELVRISPTIAAGISKLPEDFHKDPADRLIVSSAKLLSATLITKDKLIIKSKAVKTIS